MNNIDAIRALGGSGKIQPKPMAKSQKNDGPSFKDTLNSFVNDVNSMQVKADESIEKLATGELTDVHEVMNSAEEAKTAFNMMMEIRTKVTEAYDEVMRMRL